MDTCLGKSQCDFLSSAAAQVSSEVRFWSRIRLIPLRAILTPCSHRSRIRYRSGCGLQGQEGAGWGDGPMRA